MPDARAGSGGGPVASHQRPEPVGGSGSTAMANLRQGCCGKRRRVTGAGAGSYAAARGRVSRTTRPSRAIPSSICVTDGKEKLSRIPRVPLRPSKEKAEPGT